MVTSRLLAVSTVLAVLIGYAVVATRWYAQTAFQHQTRVAQIARGTTLRGILNMETGVRGFVATGDKAFLDPFASNVDHVSARFASLREAIRSLSLREDTTALVSDESTTTATWLQTVAWPLIRRPRGPGSKTMLYRGRVLIDRIRAEDRIIAAELDAAAEGADRAGLNLGMTVGSVSTGIFALLALLLWSREREDRRLRDAFDRQRVSFEAEKLIADTLGTAFLQSMLPASTRLHLDAAYVPAQEEARVGGDWYDAFELPDGRIFMTIGDVTGHGLTAAVAMSRARQALVGSALQADDPAVILARANELLMANDDVIVTALCAFVDPARASIRYASAGHPAPAIVRPGEAPALGPYGGSPLGVVRRASYVTADIEHLEGAIVVLYTDGLIECKRDAIDGERRLLDAAAAAPAAGGDLANTIRSAVFADAHATDDVAILVMRFPAVAAHGAE